MSRVSAWSDERWGWCVFEQVSELELRFVSGPYSTHSAADMAARGEPPHCSSCACGEPILGREPGWDGTGSPVP